MKKLKLNLDELTVVSFDTDTTEKLVGTVQGNADTDLCSVSCTDPLSSMYKLARTFSAIC